MRNLLFSTILIFLGGALVGGCDSNLYEPDSESVLVVGSVASTSTASKSISAMCPDVIVAVNGVPVDIVFLNDAYCNFFIPELPVTEIIDISVDIESEGLFGVISVENIKDGELIEVYAEVGEGSLTISAVRRVTPSTAGPLPTKIDENNTQIFIEPYVFDQKLTIDGNKVTLTGVAGVDCSSSGWTTITGPVTVNGNKAIFRNIKFEGRITVKGNNARFINSCFGQVPISFGNKDHDDDDKHDDEDDDD